MILLTGGTGFVGRHLMQGLVGKGGPIRVLSRRAAPPTTPPGVEWAVGDLADDASLRAAMRGVDTVVHAAAIVPATGRARGPMHEVNVAGTAALARAARCANVHRFIHVSSAGVYGDGDGPTAHRETDTPMPATAYERSKLAAEVALTGELSGGPTRWIMLRPQGLYAADRPATVAQFLEISRRRVWLHGPARTVVHPTHIDDLVAAVCCVLARTNLHGEVINIGGERALEYSELIALIGRRVNHTPLQIQAPAVTGVIARAVESVWSQFGAAPPALARQARRWINRAVDIAKARDLLHYQPISLETGLGRTAAALGYTGSAAS